MEVAEDGRGVVDRNILQLFKHEMGFTHCEVKQLREEVQRAAEKAPLFNWLKRDNDTWLKGNGEIV